MLWAFCVWLAKGQSWLSALRCHATMLRFAIAVLLLVAASDGANAAHQDWVVRHQPDRFMDRVMMEAWADADNGPSRMELFCDTENGFRVMFIPHRALIPEGPSQVTFIIDGRKPIALNAAAFGDDDTDVVAVYESQKVERLLSDAHHAVVKFSGQDSKTGEDAFTFGNLVSQRGILLKVCPVK